MEIAVAVQTPLRRLFRQGGGTEPLAFAEGTKALGDPVIVPVEGARRRAKYGVVMFVGNRDVSINEARIYIEQVIRLLSLCERRGRLRGLSVHRGVTGMDSCASAGK